MACARSDGERFGEPESFNALGFQSSFSCRPVISSRTDRYMSPDSTLCVPYFSKAYRRPQTQISVCLSLRARCLIGSNDSGSASEVMPGRRLSKEVILNAACSHPLILHLVISSKTQAGLFCTRSLLPTPCKRCKNMCTFNHLLLDYPIHI